MVDPGTCPDKQCNAVIGAVEMMLLFVFNGIGLLLLLLIFGYFICQRKSLPGPRGWPVFGQMFGPLRAENAHIQLADWAKQYGPIYEFTIGSQRFVVLADSTIIREAFVQNSKAFSGRPKLNLNYMNKNYGLVHTNGPFFREQRTFALRAFRSLGVGSRRFEDVVLDECRMLISQIEECCDHFGQMKLLMHQASANIVCSLSFGRRFDYDNTQFQSLVNDICLLSSAGTNVLSRFNHFPFLNHLSLPWDRILSFFKMLKPVVKFIENACHNSATITTPGTYVHLFTEKIAESSPGYSHFQLVHSITSLLLAGTATTATTLSWAIYLIARHERVQIKVRKELLDKCGDRTARSADRPSLPFVEAVLCEINRVASVAPIGLPHLVTDDATLRGYSIRRGTIAIPLICAAHFDEKVFANADVFWPERFIDTHGMFHRCSAVIPYSAGKRSCLGEAIANTELFIFFTSLISNYHFTLANPTATSTVPTLGVIASTPDCEILATRLPLGPFLAP